MTAVETVKKGEKLRIGPRKKKRRERRQLRRQNEKKEKKVRMGKLRGERIKGKKRSPRFFQKTKGRLVAVITLMKV